MTSLKEIIFRVIGRAFLLFKRGPLKVGLYSGNIYRLTQLPRAMDMGTIGRLFLNTYERHERNLLKNYFLGSEVVIELGSSLGVLTSEIASKCPTALIIAVEANLELAELLSVNLQHTNYAPRVKVVSSIYVGKAEIQPKFNKAGTLSSHLSLEEVTAAERPVKEMYSMVSSLDSPPAHTISLSQILHEVDICSWFSLVSDIEGAEVFLFGERDTLRSCKEIMIELHDNALLGCSVSVCELVSSFEDMGFVLIAKSARAHYFQNREFYGDEA
jgi:FkbM family methyltransferase